MRRCFFFNKQTSDRIYFFAVFKVIILQFFTILQDKLHSFNQSRTIEGRTSLAQQIMGKTML